MKNQKTSFIVLTLSLVLSVLFLVVLCLGLFGVLVPSWHLDISFNYMIGFILIAVNLGLDILFMLIEKKKLLIIPEWFRVVFFIGFFVFTNVYYYFGLYSIIYTEILFYIYLAIVFSILSISIYYNVQKNDKNVVKSNNTYAALSTFTYSTSMFMIFETALTAIKIISGTAAQNELLLALVHSCVSLFISLLISIVFYVSLTKTKKFINACLIRVNNTKENKNEVK